MKKRIILCLSALSLTIGSMLSAGAQSSSGSEMYCRIGLKYQISYQYNWGSSSAVIVDVEPGSPAEKAGLKLGDIIETVEGQPTSNMDEEVINSLLLKPNRSQVKMTVSNFGYKGKPIVLTKDCRPSEAIDEGQLAEAFGMYSLEDVTSRRFSMPFTYSTPTRKDFISYKTFSMYPIKGEYSPLDESINAVIIDQLTKRGLTHESSGGQILVKTSYKLDNNPLFRGNKERPKGEKNFRYDAAEKRMKDFPFALMSSPDFEGSYILELGIELIDAKTKERVWEVKSHERLYNSFGLDAYARSFVPLMFANFPFQRYNTAPTYVYHRRNYYYTGVMYNSNDMRHIYYVEPGSPAAQAGLKAGDLVTSINGIKSEASAETLTEAYKRFITDSFKWRDGSTVYTDNTGFKRAMYWRNDAVLQVSQMLQDRKYLPIFSYLFCFRPYVASPTIKTIVFEVKRGNESLSVLVTPKLVNRDTIELL